MVPKDGANKTQETTPTPTELEKMRGLPWATAFNTLNTFFVQFTFFGSVFVLFLDRLGLDKIQIGFLLALLPFLDLIALWIAPAVSRFGYKRTFLTFWSIRTVITAFLLLTGWVLERFGVQVALSFIAVLVTAFAISRSTAITALMPWSQEYIPSAIRGKYSATKNIFVSLAGLIAVTSAGYVIATTSGLNGFILLFGLALVFGAASIWSASHIPGGAPVRQKRVRRVKFRLRLAPLRDRSFLFYLFGSSLIALATTPLASFLPLFMQEKVGLSAGDVILLQNGTLLGGLVSSYLWGWAADRYGSKPVMLSGVYLIITLPVLWLLMPRGSVWSLYVALGIAFLQGLALLSWGIGSARLLFVSVVPQEKKNEYLPLYTAWVGIIAAASQLLGGWLLDSFSGISGWFLFFEIDSYTILFLAGLVLPVLSILVFRSVRPDSTVSVSQFAGLFFHGNPFMAAGSMFRYHVLARDERATVSVTEMLGQTKSPLTVEELVDALSDPRFYVRFEAIVSIARRGPDPQLMDALIHVLEGNDPALSVIAAWALGRIGDQRALGPLRKGLEAPYRSIRVHCARSLGTLGDREVIPLLLERLAIESDRGLQVAYATSLGKLKVEEAVPKLLSLLRASAEQTWQQELSLALARIVGEEKNFISLLRKTREDAGTSLSQSLLSVKRKLHDLQLEGEEIPPLLEQCVEALSRQELDEGLGFLTQIIDLLLQGEVCKPCDLILTECARRMEEFRATRLEYAILALHTLNDGL